MVEIKVDKTLSNDEIDDLTFCPDCQAPKWLCICPKNVHLTIDKKVILFHNRDGKIVEQVVESFKEAEFPKGRPKQSIPKENRLNLSNPLKEKITCCYIPGKAYLSLYHTGGHHESSYWISAKELNKLIVFLLKMKKKMFMQMPEEKLPSFYRGREV